LTAPKLPALLMKNDGSLMPAIGVLSLRVAPCEKNGPLCEPKASARTYWLR
jgi:hypothetical protein